MCLLYMDNVKKVFYELSSWCYRPAKLAYGPLGTARDSFCFFKWSNFSPLNFVKLTTQCNIGSLSYGVFEQRSSTRSGLYGFLSCGFAQIHRQIVSVREDTTQYKFDRQ